MTNHLLTVHTLGREYPPASKRSSAESRRNEASSRGKVSE